MSEDPVRARLDEIFQRGAYAVTTVIALRAVLDLHHPAQPPMEDGVRWCDWCHGREEYPCHTVRAIAAALGVDQAGTP